MPTLKTLAREIQLKSYDEGEVIFEQNSIGQTFYVLLTGSVYGFVKSEEYDEVGELVSKNKRIFVLKPGEYFGEIALMHKQALRSCSVAVCADDTFLMELSKAAFDKFVGEYKTESVKSIIEFYKVCPFYHRISDQKKVELAAKSFLIKYPTNALILRQNDIVYNLYFVAKGAVRLVRRIKPKKESPGDDPRGRLFQTDVMEEGSPFADFEIFNKRGMMDSVITTMPTTIIYIPYFSILERLNHDDVSKLKLEGKPKQEDDKVMESFKENAKWDRYKKDLVQSAFFEKQSKSKISNLRDPPKYSKTNEKKNSEVLLKLMNPGLGLTVRHQSHLKLPTLNYNKIFSKK